MLAPLDWLQPNLSFLQILCMFYHSIYEYLPYYLFIEFKIHFHCYIFQKRVSEIYSDGYVSTMQTPSQFHQPNVELKDCGQCQVCGSVTSKRCARCKSVWYCKKECQIKNWGCHKLTCTPINWLNMFVWLFE